MELLFLGTGAGSPTISRNVSSLALFCRQKENEIWLFDCGEGTLRQLLFAKVKISKITKIFITHLHADHILGLPGILLNPVFRQRKKTLEIYCLPELKHLLMQIFVVTQSELTFPLEFIELKEGIIFENEYFKIEAFELMHRVLCFGFRISQLINEKKVIAIFGDTIPTENGIKLAKNADIMVCEGTYLEPLIDKARKYYHSTAEETIKLANKAKVKQLFITHISSRYNDDRFFNKIKNNMTVEFAKDLMVYVI